ncbi:HIT domain-containing protein [Criblamydia sequanensis]|uniref:HIT domain-containing protein n=1 Tax=Candidatus Criblamydia sequanensis CRIB-18 TaxID=1437425 RepID=A0A090D0R3_9BACT|nr:HIT domain-containing protein [Criblamydia sequanensis]CDR33163.1 hypothetical protein CSEC_0324 [Criblamydia sequanensis CRIB-18]
MSDKPLLEFQMQKLIRDKIPDLFSSDEVLFKTEILDEACYRKELKEKLKEETFEILNTSTKEELKEELADLLEVIESIIKAEGLSWEEVKQIQKKKRESKGGFDSRLLAHCVQIKEGNKEASYFKKRDLSMEHDCLFCKFLRDDSKIEVVGRFKHCFVMKDRYPVAKGHILIIPYVHYENWFEAKPEVQHEIIEILNVMKKKWDKVYAPDGYNIGANAGRAAGQTVMHLHVHLIPRYKGDMEDPRGGVRGVIPEKQKYG